MKDKKQRIDYLSRVVSSNGQCEYEGPNILYKYRPFDEYTYDMLADKTLFLCKASRLDDETECMSAISIDDIYEYQANSLKLVCVKEIIEFVKPYCSKEDYEQILQMVSRCVSRNGNVRRDFLIDFAPDIQELAPDFDSAILINSIANIPDRLDDPRIKPQVESLIMKAINSREETGVCSLSENENDPYMWLKYASNSEGYCIEYDISSYKFKKGILPVIYSDERETRIVMCIVSDFVGEFVTAISHGQLEGDNTQYIRLFLSKFQKWEYQNEWRIIGKPDADFPAPKVKRIILGKNVSLKNEKAMREFCFNHNIEIIKL